VCASGAGEYTRGADVDDPETAAMVTGRRLSCGPLPNGTCRPPRRSRSWSRTQHHIQPTGHST